MRIACCALAGFFVMPIVGTVTALAFRYGGPGWAGAACCLTLLACACAAVKVFAG